MKNRTLLILAFVSISLIVLGLALWGDIRQNNVMDISLAQSIRNSLFAFGAIGSTAHVLLRCYWS